MFKKKGIVGIDTKKSIATIDPYSNSSIIFKDNKFELSSAKTLAKDHFFVSFIEPKDIIFGSVEIARNISEEDLSDAIEIKVYDELGLDSGIEYKIYHFESQNQDSSNRVFDVIAYDKESLYDIYKDVKHVKYIDYITTAPLLFKSLYTKSILEPSKTDCFIYFHKDDAHVSIYQDGKFLFSKSIRYSLSVISDTFSKSLGKRVDESEFYNMLKKSGLQNSDPAYQKELMKLFGEVFVYINDVILYAKRAYSINNIDQVYISSDLGDILGIDEFCHNYVNIPSKKLEIKVAKNSDEIDNLSPMDSLMVLAAQEYMSSGDDEINLSIFKKPPPFNKRASGKLIQVAAASLLLSLIYPAYQFVQDKFFLQVKLDRLKQKESSLSRESANMKTAFAKLKKEMKSVDDKLAKKSDELDFRTKLLHEIYVKKVSYPMKAKIMTDLFDKIVKHDSKVVLVDNNSSDMFIKVRSKSDKHITELLSELAHFNQYNVSTDTIKKDNNETYYESLIKVGLNVR